MERYHSLDEQLAIEIDNLVIQKLPVRQALQVTLQQQTDGETSEELPWAVVEPER